MVRSIEDRKPTSLSPARDRQSVSLSLCSPWKRAGVREIAAPGSGFFKKRLADGFPGKKIFFCLHLFAMFFAGDPLADARRQFDVVCSHAHIDKTHFGGDGAAGVSDG